MPTGYDPSDLDRLVQEYLNTKSMADKVNTRLDELKATLTKYVDNHGQPDEKGSLWLPVGSCQIKKERRSSKFFDEDAATAWAKEQGIFNDVKRIVIKEWVDMDLLLEYAWEHREVAPVIESFNKEKVTWAFKVVEKQAFIDES